MLCDLEELKKIYAKTFRILGEDKNISDIEVRFYPYIGIKNKIGDRNGKIFVKIGEICREMSVEEHEALAFILVSKATKKKIPAAAQKIFSDFGKKDEIRAKAVENRRVKGRKVITTSKGEFYDLETIFETVNHIYFDNTVPKPVLTWSARKTYRILGHYDSAHQTIVISRSLDRKKVPWQVVHYILHEMLHILHPITHKNGRRSIHSPAFRHAEKEFEYFDEAENWIEKNVKALKRHATGRLFF